MTKHSELPGFDYVRRVVDEVTESAKQAGTIPSTPAVARRLRMSNTTFRRNFPEIVRELGELRRTPTRTDQDTPDGQQRHIALHERNAKLLRDNRALHDQLGVC